MTKGMIAVGVTAILGAVTAASLATTPWEVEYHAESGLLPENTGAGWQFDINDARFTRSVANGILNVNTMTGDPYSSEGWESHTGKFDFKKGFVIEEQLQLLAATTLYDRWGGASLSAQGTDRAWLNVEVDTGKVTLASVGGNVSYAMNTTSALHLYRSEVSNDTANLFVDGTLRLTLPLESNNPTGYAYFGDQGWEGGNINYAYVRYGSVPEPTTAAVLSFLGLSLLRRRRTRSQNAIG